MQYMSYRYIYIFDVRKIIFGRAAFVSLISPDPKIGISV